ncbi:lipopolysaccharide biosynthesis protein [Altericroceibacterium xinjiangense]|uniref:lipopolysaccharide biosynthesis protein n=1 Tax=Altericroceibacterium xinjiangense TaxID=762261 RepID=UPI000F7DCF54|nr:lipopolysaccharide biosynthesis protein [Altericroceibacterium xinjiangense]
MANLVDPDIRPAAAADPVSAKPHRTPSLKRDAAWTAADTLFSSGLAFLFRLVVARFVAPAEFGVFALALTTFAIVQVFNEFGMAAAIIQRSEDRFTRELVDTAYASSTLVSTGLFAINLLVIAPLAAWIYGSERVGLVTAVIGVSFLFTPAVSIARALLFRARDYRAVTIARIVSTLLSLVVAGVVLALYQNVWALVVQIVSAQVFLAIMMRWVGEWRPRFKLSRNAFREMIGYSGLVFANDAFNAVAKNLDIIVLGRVLTQNQVGLYSLAFYITDVLRLHLTSILNRVMFTQYATLQNDYGAVRFYIVRTMSVNALIIMPLMITLTLAGPIVLPEVLGETWRGMGPTLQLLALSVMLSALGGTTSTAFKALGRPGLEFAITVGTSTLLLAPALVIGVYVAGIEGAAAAVVFNVLLSVIVRQVALNRLVGSTLVPVIRAAAGSLLAQVPIVLVWFAAMAVLPFAPAVNAVVASVLGLAGYGCCLLLLFLCRVESEAWPAFSRRRYMGDVTR